MNGTINDGEQLMENMDMRRQPVQLFEGEGREGGGEGGRDYVLFCLTMTLDSLKPLDLRSLW